MLPAVIATLLAIVFGRNLIIVIVLVSLLTLVGDLGRSLRIVVYVVDFSVLGILFLQRYGINFQMYPKIPKSLLYFLMLYFSTITISAVMSDYPFAGLGLIFQQFALFIIAYVFYGIIESELEIELYFISVVVVAFILATSSLIVFLQGDISLLDIVSPNRPRVSALIGNLEAYTNFFVVSFPLIIGSIFLKKSYNERKIEIILLSYFILGLILAMSRSAILGIMLSTFIIFFILNRRRFYQLTIIVSVIILAFLIYQPLNDLMTTILRIESGMSARDYIWKMSMDMISDNFFFGVGPGAYKYEMMNYFPYMLNDWWGNLFLYFSEVTEGANLSHNFFLTFFTDMGILGFITAVSLPLIFFRIGIKTIMKYKNNSMYYFYLVVSLFAAGSSIIGRNIFNSIGLLYVGGLHTDLPFWLVFGSLIYLYRLPQKLEQPQNSLLMQKNK